MNSKRKPEINDEENFDWLTVAEACEVLKCSKRKINELRKDGRLEVVKFDHANRVTKRSLNCLLSQIFSGEIMSKLKLASIVQKIEDDLEYRLPTTGKALTCVLLSREQAEALLTEISELRMQAGEKNAKPSR